MRLQFSETRFEIRFVNPPACINAGFGNNPASDVLPAPGNPQSLK